MSLDVHLEMIVDTGGSMPTTFPLFWANITHNLGEMAEAAGIYKHLWRPEELGIKTAGELVEPLTVGVELMKHEPDKFRKLEPSNKWGTYADFVPWIERYAQACKEHPKATIRISR